MDVGESGSVSSELEIVRVYIKTIKILLLALYLRGTEWRPLRSRSTETHGTFTVLLNACPKKIARPARSTPATRAKAVERPGPSAAPPVAEEATHERNAATDADDSIDGLNVGLSRGGQHERSRAQREAVGVGIGRVAIGTSLVLNASESAALAGALSGTSAPPEYGAPRWSQQR